VLGLPHATIIMAVEKTDGAIRVKRELEDGWFQQVEMPLPSVLTIQSGINKLRYATLMGIKKAKTKEIKKVAVSELGVSRHRRGIIRRLLPSMPRADAQLAHRHLLDLLGLGLLDAHERGVTQLVDAGLNGQHGRQRHFHLLEPPVLQLALHANRAIRFFPPP